MAHARGHDVVPAARSAPDNGITGHHAHLDQWSKFGAFQQVIRQEINALHAGTTSPAPLADQVSDGQTVGEQWEGPGDRPDLKKLGAAAIVRHRVLRQRIAHRAKV